MVRSSCFVDRSPFHIATGAMLSWLLLIMCDLRSVCATGENVNINLQPRNMINADNIGWRFAGNTTLKDYFKLLELDANSLLVGARDAVYNLSMTDLSIQKKLSWPSTIEDQKRCVTMKGAREEHEDCHNYVRVLVRQPSGLVLICATHSFNPMCRQYRIDDRGDYQIVREFSGSAISPRDPQHNSTAIYVSETDELYAATVVDFAGLDPLIYRKSLSGGTAELSTPRNDLAVLNDPNFVAASEDNDHVYFWFREVAAETEHTGKTVYPRVGRVCKRDQGGPRRYEDTWTTFIKARLNCSLPGDYRDYLFYFNDLQATSSIVQGRYGSAPEDLVYAVLTTPFREIQAAAICAFPMSEVRRVFAKGNFRLQEGTGGGFGLRMADQDMMQPRPGGCSKNSKLLNDKVVNFVQRNPLMYDTVSNYFDQPILVETSSKLRFTQIAVDPQVKSVDGRNYDVVFVGTEDGRLLKLVNTADGRRIRSALIESTKVFSDAQPVKNLLVYRPSAETDSAGGGGGIRTPKIVAVSDEEVRALPLHYCHNQSSCGACVHLQDPYCAWDLIKGQCVGRVDGDWSNGDFVQSIETGRSSLCPEGEYYESPLYSFDVTYPARAHQSALIYSGQSMAIAIIATLALALMIGFFGGFRFARARQPDPTYDVPNHPRSHSSLTNHIDVYASPPSMQNSKLSDAVNLVLTMQETKTCEKNGFLLNNGTLPKDYKARKVYL